MKMRRSKIPWHIYAKHQYRQESEFKNCGALYIPTHEYNYKVITRCDTILKEYYITDRCICENTKRYTSMNSIKGAHELQKENSRDEQGAWKDRALHGLSMIHAFRCASLISNLENPQAPNSEIWTWGSRRVRTPQWVVMRMPNGVQR